MSEAKTNSPPESGGVPSASPSPSGRGWREAPDEGRSDAMSRHSTLTRPSGTHSRRERDLALGLPRWAKGLTQERSVAGSAFWAFLFIALLTIAALAQTAVENFTVLRDVAATVALTLMNVSGEGRNDYIIEVNGNGAAFFDYDNDGDMDVLITNGSTLKHYATGGDPVVALYENVDGRFRDRTAQSGLDKKGWASGVCV